VDNGYIFDVNDDSKIVGITYNNVTINVGDEVEFYYSDGIDKEDIVKTGKVIQLFEYNVSTTDYTGAFVIISYIGKHGTCSYDVKLFGILDGESECWIKPKKYIVDIL